MQFLHRVFANLKAEVLFEVFDIKVYDLVRGCMVTATVQLALPHKIGIFAVHISHVSIALSHRGVPSSLFQHPTDVVNVVRAKGERLREIRAGEHVLVGFAFVFFKEASHFLKVCKLLFKAGFPNGFNARVCFILHAGPVEIALHVFVFKKPSEPTAFHVHK